VERGIYNLENCYLIVEGNVGEIYRIKNCEILVGGKIGSYELLEGCIIYCDWAINKEMRKINSSNGNKILKKEIWPYRPKNFKFNKQ